MRLSILFLSKSVSPFRLLFCYGLGSAKADAQLIQEWTKLKHGIQFQTIKYSGYGQGIERPWKVDDWAHDIASELRSNYQKTIVVCISAGAQAFIRAICQSPALLNSINGLMMVSPGVGMEVDNYIQRVLPTKLDELKAGAVVAHPSIDPAIKIGIDLVSLKDYQQNCILHRQPMPSFGFPVRIVHGIYDKLVPFKNSIKLLDMIYAKDKALFLVNSGHLISEQSTLLHAMDSLWKGIFQRHTADSSFEVESHEWVRRKKMAR